MPDKVINQIAAGEVIQRPSSIVKELLENSIDAGADSIQLKIKKSGKELVQIIDNGKGMHENDAKICFQKHTTSKIQTTEDIMNITTMGFRGEALASIASIASVEMKTKSEDDDVGTEIYIDNSEIKKIKKIATKNGTSISVKNLFFNIPARKNFLKSDKIEMKHILEVFIQIAISNNNITFKLTNNEKVVFNIEKTNFKQRIIQVFGQRYNKKLFPIKEKTSIVEVSGFLGNPIDSKKTRGEQFLYVNNRYIKSGYLNHAIKHAMEGLITNDQHPSYFIFLNISPSLIDINIHPNKTEVKFEDEKAIYQILKATCKRSIGMYNIIPSLDFSTEQSFEIPVHIQQSTPKEPKIKINKNFNPFQEKEYKDNLRHKENTNNFDTLFEENTLSIVKEVINIDKLYAMCTIITNNQVNVSLIDKKRAMQRINYEKNSTKIKNRKITSQRIIKPYTIDLTVLDLDLVDEYKQQIVSLGYSIEKMTNKKLIINAIPSGLKIGDLKEFFELFIEEIKKNNTNIKDRLISETAKQITYNQTTHINMNSISNEHSLKSMIKELLNCTNPFISIDGNPCMINIEPVNIFNAYKHV